MSRETKIWGAIFLLGALGLILRAIFAGGLFGTAYIELDEKRFVNVGTADDPNWVDYDDPAILDREIAQTPFAQIPDDRKIHWTRPVNADLRTVIEADQRGDVGKTYALSVPRTIGLWLAAFFTLAIFSFLYKDNPFYKVAEAVVVGVSAAYWMVVGFWDVIVPNLMGSLVPTLVKNWALPGLSDTTPNYLYLVPLLLGVLLVWRLAPVGGWISRWPLAFIIGTTAGIRLIGFLQADFLSQIQNSIMPLVVVDPVGGFDPGETFANLLVVVGVLTCLVYFFFSIEHKGIVGKTARVGIWVLMITFGAGFGFTVMGRIALLAIRIEFLFDDWLWLIDPTNTRTLVSALGVLY